ncbi:MAG: hypothetical protein KBB32_07485 [Spirochaetia bacterium]|nr:hypothetical protein [Spirochaetia bacterium]
MDKEVIRVELLDEFKGDSVILVVLNSPGLILLQSTIAFLDNEGKAEVAAGGKLIALSISTVDEVFFDKDRTNWEITEKTKRVLTDQLASMASFGAPCHHYLDIERPVTSIILSLNEYT